MKRAREVFFDPIPVSRYDKAKRVLRKIVKAPIVVAVIPFTPKYVQAMFNWIKERVSEPSTYHGLNAFAGAVGMTINPEAFELIVQMLLAVAGIIEIVRKGEKFINKNDQPEGT